MSAKHINRDSAVPCRAEGMTNASHDARHSLLTKVTATYLCTTTPCSDDRLAHLTWLAAHPAVADMTTSEKKTSSPPWLQGLATPRPSLEMALEPTKRDTQHLASVEGQA
ncbi:hypothetical protein E2C01_007337 [Portunus trituberculatus]|uniref:Uncharacterized protein n=1 Tax=Portunus trituberculatus TaxID=210409 RepID=A0A5B7CZ64_PORTR|nr:hypothetical protein [Portunus trituberculatus]